MRITLEAQVRQPGFRVVPVLLPGATMPGRAEWPGFLSWLTIMNSHDRLGDPEAFRELLAGIRGVAPGRTALAIGTALAVESPYRGLQVFEETHARVFFWRETDIQHLLEALQAQASWLS
jgi:hypothetical protein